MEKIEFNLKKNQKINPIHVMLAYAYAIFFLSVILGVLFDLVFKVDLLDNFHHSYIGIMLIFLGSLLVYLAQSASSRASKIKFEERSVAGFAFGPYKYFRHPTYLGVFIMVLGFGITIKSTFSVLFILITYLFVKLFFVKKEEKILEQKYGQIYLYYKKKVKITHNLPVNNR